MHTFEAQPAASNINGTSHQTKKHEEVIKIITQQRQDDTYLDLANKSLSTIPPELFILPHIQHLYLEDNFIKELPDRFFDHLPSLQWLDLRNNKLAALPISIGRHKCIKHLLLEGNNLTKLPLQMGMTKCLNGLNLRGNPLIMPPQHIVDQGVYVILSYLYQELQNRTKENTTSVTPAVDKLSLVEEVESNSENEIPTDRINLAERDIPSPMSDDFELLRHTLTPMTATLHRPLTFQDIKGRHNSLFDGLKKSRKGKDLSLLELREQEDLRKEQLRSLKERQVAHDDQRRKDTVALDDWRNETRRRQRYFPRSNTDVNMNPAPYGTDDQSRHLHSNGREEQVEHVPPTEGPAASTSKKEAAPGRSHMMVEVPNRVNEQRGFPKEEPAAAEKSEKEKPPGDCEPWCGKKSRPNSVAKNRKEAKIQQRKQKYSNDVHQKLKKLRDDELSGDSSGQTQSRELQRQILEQKMSNSKDPELEYRFRAFTGETASQQSGSNQTASM